MNNHRERAEEMAEETRCTVEGSWDGIPMEPCEDPVTHVAVITCEKGCKRDPLNVCQFHADVLSSSEELSFCGLCRKKGDPEVNVHLTSLTPVEDSDG